MIALPLFLILGLPAPRLFTRSRSTSPRSRSRTLILPLALPVPDHLQAESMASICNLRGTGRLDPRRVHPGRGRRGRAPGSPDRAAAGDPPSGFGRRRLGVRQHRLGLGLGSRRRSGYPSLVRDLVVDARPARAEASATLKVPSFTGSCQNGTADGSRVVDIHN